MGSARFMFQVLNGPNFFFSGLVWDLNGPREGLCITTLQTAYIGPKWEPNV